MIQKVHLFLMMFTKCSLRVTSAYSGRSHKKKFTLWWILPGFTFSTITNSTCQPIFGIHNFTIPIKYHSLILKHQLEWSKRLTCFSWCLPGVPLMLVKPGSQSIQGHSHKRSSPYDGSYQDSHFSTIIKSICQTTSGIKNFQSKSNILARF